MPESPIQPLPPIAESLRGRTIFVTGATGFVGKVVVEKLLWAVPDVGKLLLLVRPDRERSATERVREEILEARPFARLRALHGEGWASWADEKIEIVPGDLAEDSFGLDRAAYGELARSVDAVVASAATVRFDERLDRALETNVRGAVRALRLARDAGGVPLVQLSTAFVSGRRSGAIEEEPAALGGPPATSEPRDEVYGRSRRSDRDPAVAPGADPEELLAELDRVARGAGTGDGAERRQVAAGRKIARRHGFHDVYTLTKALAERLIERRRGEAPVAVVRPGIVESAFSEPMPGWIDGVRVADPLLVAYGRGRLRTLPGNPGAALEMVPVDLVANAVIAALAAVGSSPRDAASPDRRTQAAGSASAQADSPVDASGLTVYQIGSGGSPVELGELLEGAREGFGRCPMRTPEGRPIAVRGARFLPLDRYRRRLRRRRAWLAALSKMAAFAWRGRGLALRLAARLSAIDHFDRLLDLYGPYLDHPARYDDTRARALAARLAPEDRVRFGFDASAIDWRRYVAETHLPGLLRYALKAETGSPAPEDPQRPAELDLAPATRSTTLFELLRLAAERYPERVALQACREGRWLRYTYAEAVAATANIARVLEGRHGIGRGDRVALWASGRPEWVLTAFAVHRLGAAIVPLDPQWPAAEVEEAARFAGAKLLCAAPDLASRLTGASLPVAELAPPLVPEPWVGLLPGAEAIGNRAAPGDLAAILFTSGTTVEPKAVPLTHANYLANVRDLAPVMESNGERLLSVLPIHHAFEYTVGLLVPLAGGGTVSYVEKIDPAEISWMMGATRPTMLVAVPRLLELLHNGIRRSVEAAGPGLVALFAVLGRLSDWTGGRWGHRLFGKVHRRFGGALRRIATGGARLDPRLGESFRRMGFAVAEGYGMTETSPVLTVNPWDAIRYGAVGLPLPGVEIELRPVVGEPEGTGEIAVRGANVLARYYRNPAATAEVMTDGWFVTGDIGRFDADGYLTICGRTKEVIVTAAGKNVYPEEVEARYRGLPGVEELVVLGLPAPGGGEIVGAVVVPGGETPAAREGNSTAAAGGRVAAEEAIRTAIDERSRTVPSYQRIARIIVWRDELPKTTTLKVKRRALGEAVRVSGAADAGAGRVATSAPRTLESPPVAKPHATGAAQRAATARPGHDRPTRDVAAESETAVLELVGRLTHTRPEALSAADRLSELGVDSLTLVELVAELEMGHGVRIEQPERLERVADLLAWLPAPPPGEAVRGRAAAAAIE